MLVRHLGGEAYPLDDPCLSDSENCQVMGFLVNEIAPSDATHPVSGPLRDFFPFHTYVSKHT